MTITALKNSAAGTRAGLLIDHANREKATNGPEMARNAYQLTSGKPQRAVFGVYNKRLNKNDFTYHGKRKQRHNAFKTGRTAHNGRSLSYNSKHGNGTHGTSGGPGSTPGRQQPGTAPALRGWVRKSVKARHHQASTDFQVRRH